MLKEIVLFQLKIHSFALNLRFFLGHLKTLELLRYNYSCHETVRQILQIALKDFCRITNEEMCCNESELYEVIGTYEETLILLDKYFFGYVMDYKIRGA